MEFRRELLEGVTLTPIRKIEHFQGDIFHVLKSNENSYKKFGEAYFTTVHKGEIKGWKMHSKMIMNLVVPVGEVGFYFYNKTRKKSAYVELSLKNYMRLTVQPNTWVAFEGLNEHLNLILNIASIIHDPNEAINIDLKEIPLVKINTN
jgi:dTDP-4-dehydrorhamnose 3,5-epimerase